MEDPKRMRTKLRLDLKDVRRQIEDLEDLLKKDKSPENVEAHRKLVEYEKKLKEQYEKMTGLSVDQASNLERKDYKIGVEEREKTPFSGLLALLGGLLVAWGYYNSVLHSITGFAPTDLLDYFMGSGNSVSGLNFFMSSLLYEISFFLVILPIGVGSLFVLISGLLDGSRQELYGFLEGLGFLGAAGLFSYTLYSADGVAATASDLFLDNLLYFGVAVMVSGLFLLIGAFGHQGSFRRFLGTLTGLLVVFSGVQYLVLSMLDNVETEIVQQWPWVTVPLVLAAGIYGFIGFLRIIK